MIANDQVVKRKDVKPLFLTFYSSFLHQLLWLQQTDPVYLFVYSFIDETVECGLLLMLQSYPTLIFAMFHSNSYNTLVNPLSSSSVLSFV